MSKINLSEWLDSRGVFKDVSFGEVELQIVSLSKDLIEDLKALPTHEMMLEFVAEAGLSHHRMRMIDDEELEKDLPIIWALPEFEAEKANIVMAIADLNEAGNVLTNKMDEEELAEIEAEDIKKLNADEEEAHEENDNLIKKALAENPNISLEQIASDVAAHNNI